MENLEKCHNRQMRAKVTLVGTDHSGKTCFQEALRRGEDSRGLCQPTIGAAYSTPHEPPLVDCRPVNVTIWDTAGKRGYWQLLKLYLPDSAVVLFFVCGIRANDDAELYQLHDYLVAENQLPADSLKAVVCGFADIGIDPGLHDRVSEWASQHGYPYFEIDCQNYDQVTNVFDEMLYRRLGTNH